MSLPTAAQTLSGNEKEEISVLAMGSEMVTLTVGPVGSQKTFTVHKTLLCKKIPYFEKMFGGNCKESSDNIVTFPEDWVQSFDVLLSWVYTGVLRPWKYDHGKWSWNTISFYALAEKILLPHLQDMTMDLVHEQQSKKKTRYYPIAISTIFSSIHFDGGLRKYAAMTTVWVILKHKEESGDQWKTSDIQELLNSNKELGLAVFTLMRGCHQGVLLDPLEMPNCEFHHHKMDEPCLLA